MCVQGVATRKVKGVTEALCGHSFSASSISAINKSPDQSFKAVAERRLSKSDPDLIPDAGYEGAARRVSLSAGRCWWRSRLIEGRRRMLAVALANRESRSSRREFLLGFTVRGLTGVEFAMSDDRPGLKQAIGEVLPETVRQRCCAPFLRNALDHAPRKVDDDCLRELRWLGARPRAGRRREPGDRRDLAELRRHIARWLATWQAKHPRLCPWVEDTIEEMATYYRLPLPHRKHMKSTNMLERLNRELKRRTHMVRIVPSAESCLRLVRALVVERRENWLEATRCLNMDHRKEHNEALRALAA
jgi:putative transposase